MWRNNLILQQIKKRNKNVYDILFRIHIILSVCSRFLQHIPLPQLPSFHLLHSL